MSTPKPPDPFLVHRVLDTAVTPSITGLCVGYELNVWRAVQFAEHIMEWLPEFALKHSEAIDYHSGNAVQRMREAARRVYTSKKFEKRGEFGELFLHAAVRQVFGSLPAISKIYYKSAHNDTVKGFDAVHVVEGQGGLELWLGEAKFYDDVTSAIRDVVDELAKHTDADYLRDEFLLIKGKVDPAWPRAKEFEELINRNNSLDDVFTRVCVPVLLTYDSDCVKGHKDCSDAYAAEFEKEVRQHRDTFAGKNLPTNVVIHLILIPLNSKKELVAQLDEKLKAWQKL